MTDPQPISVAEAREKVAWLALTIGATMPPSNYDRHRLWQRILATAQQAERRWVPVSERVPEGFAWVLAYHDGMMATMLYSSERGFHGRTENNMAMFADRITHWMPLPAQPEV